MPSHQAGHQSQEPAVMRLLSTLSTIIILILFVVVAAALIHGSLPVLNAADTWAGELKPYDMQYTTILLLSTALALLSGFMVALFLSEYSSGASKTMLTGLLKAVSGFPVILLGLLLIQTNTGSTRQLLLYIVPLVIGILAMPLFSHWYNAVMVKLPGSLRIAAAALGASRSYVLKGLLLPTALPALGAATGILVIRVILEIFLAVYIIKASPQTTYIVLPVFFIFTHAINQGSEALITLLIRKVLHVRQ